MAAVEVKGVAELRSALRKFEPNLSKELSAEMRKELSPIAREAKGYIPSSSPMSGWVARPFSEARFPFFNASVMKSGIGFKTTGSKPNRKGFKSQAQLFNKSAAGAIYETAGRKNPQGKTKQGAKFIENMGGMSGSGKDRGRALYRAYENNKGAAKAAIMAAIATTEQKFNAAQRKAK